MDKSSSLGKKNLASLKKMLWPLPNRSEHHQLSKCQRDNGGQSPDRKEQ